MFEWMRTGLKTTVEPTDSGATVRWETVADNQRRHYDAEIGTTDAAMENIELLAIKAGNRATDAGVSPVEMFKKLLSDADIDATVCS